MSSPMTCADATVALSNALRENWLTIDTQVAKHIAGCNNCRATMLLMVRALSPDPAHRLAPDEETCSRCQDDLAAFVDLEQVNVVRAATVYPHVWWHLWTCPHCARTYDLTRELLRAESAGRIPSLHEMILSTRPPQPLWRFPIPRMLIEMMLPKSPLRAKHDQFYLLYQSRPSEQGVVYVQVQAQDAGHWTMAITLSAARSGVAVLMCGSFRWAGVFGADGTAWLYSLPAPVLNDAQEPDLDISIFPASVTT